MKTPWRGRLAALAAAGALLPGCGHMGWLPENINGAYGDAVDGLYFKIMAVVAVAFFLTEGLLLFAILRFRAAGGRKAIYSHGSKRTELLWSILPGFILIWLALAQKDTWFKIRERFPREADATVVQVFPEQFAWNFRYAGADGKFATEDDVTSLNSLHVPVGADVVTRMSSKDVIHSFFLPLLRVKQDVLPGMLTRVWFRAEKIGAWNLRTNRLELLTPAAFDARKVALPVSSEAERPGFVLRYGVRAADGTFTPEGTPGGRRKTGQRDIGYDPPRAAEIAIAQGGAVKTLPWAEAEYVLHPVDLACAELCGLNHWKMRGMLWIEPKFLFDGWMQDRAKYIAEYGDDLAPKWQRIWDEVHPAYNRQTP